MHIPASERLSYRQLLPSSVSDQKHMLQLDQDPNVMKFINGGKPTSEDEMQNVMVPRLSAYTIPDKGWGMWGVFDKHSEAFYGWVLVRPMHFFSDECDESDLELGWRFVKSSWGKGIATEAARQIMQALHQQTGIKTFSAIADTDNKASIRIMEKLGMTFVKSGIHKDPLGDMEVDTYSVVITESMG